jgi:hypothetical protein
MVGDLLASPTLEGAYISMHNKLYVIYTSHLFAYPKKKKKYYPTFAQYFCKPIKKRHATMLMGPLEGSG